MASMLALYNYVDRSSVTITASPTALAGLPVTNLKVPFFDGVARGSSAAYTYSLSWEQAPAGVNDPGDITDLVAVLGTPWRSGFSADLRWWNTGGSWSSPLGSTTQWMYYSGTSVAWPGSVPRHVFVPLPSSTAARYWRIDVTIGQALEGAAWAWEARRLWSGPALRFGVRSPLEGAYRGTRAVAVGETGIPTVSSGRAYRRVAFGGRALPQVDVLGPTLSGLHSLHQLMYDRGVESEAILLPRIETTNIANQVQTMAIYGRLVDELRVVQGKGSRFEVSGTIQEVPCPLPSPLVAPT